MNPTNNNRRHGLSLALTLCVGGLAGCPGDDGSASDTEDGSSTGSSTGTPPVTTTTGTDPSGSSNSSSSGGGDGSSSDDGLDSTSTTTDDPSTSTGEVLPGTCVGVDSVGDIASIYSRGGAPIDTTCNPAAAGCGGDVLGTWTIEGSCGYESIPNPLADDCPGSTFELAIISESGTLELLDDGTFIQDLMLVSDIIVTLDPMACYGVSCAQFGDALAMDTPGSMCADLEGTCTCTVPNSDGSSDELMGTYEVNADILTLITPEGDSDAAFCVTDDRLDLWQPVLDGTVTEEPCADEADCEAALGDTHEFYLCSLE